MKSRSARSVPALTQNHISVLRRTVKWEGEEGSSRFFFLVIYRIQPSFLRKVKLSSKKI